MVWIKFLLLFINFALISGISDSNDSWKELDVVERRFSILTSYKYIANNDDTEIKFPECETKKLWILVKNGMTRPNKKQVANILALHSKILNKTKNSETKLIKSLSPEIILNCDQLMESGKKNLIELGMKFRRRFQTLITDENCDKKLYELKTINTSVYKKSATFFTTGLEGFQTGKNCWDDTSSKSPEHLLEFHKHCNKSQGKHQDKKFPKILHQFKSTKVLKKMLENLSNNLGFNATLSDAMNVYKMCAREKGYYESNIDTPWCNLLSIEDIKILEYMDDLYHYWYAGYGYPLNYKQACPLLSNVFEYFDSNTPTKVKVNIGDNESMLRLLTLLGIGNDTYQLQSDSYSTSAKRKWRTSLLSPYSANIAFVYYECGVEKIPKILFLHQERITQLPGCGGQKLCPLSTMKDLYPDNNDKCKYKEMCNINK